MATQEENPIRDILANTPITNIQTPKGKVVIIQSTSSLYEGFKTLVDNNILSAPVYDVKEKKYTGFLDIKDLVSFVVFVDDDQKSDVPQNLHELIMHGCKLFKVPLEGVTCTYLSRRNTFHPVSQTDSLLKVCETLAKGVHRVPVVNETGEVINIISQSSIVGFLAKNLPRFKGHLNKTIKELNLGTRPVISVREDTPAIETFRLMDNKKISGVAVVDARGRFTGNTSASDLKLFMKTLSLEILSKPITEFLKLIRQASLEEKTPTVSCSTRDTVEKVIAKLASTKIHKLFIANDEEGYVPSCVVSITDILRYLLKH